MHPFIRKIPLLFFALFLFVLEVYACERKHKNWTNT